MADRCVVVTADDFGLTRATSEACVRAHGDGIVSAVSVLGNGVAVEETAPLLRHRDGLSIGAHLVLVGEDPPRSPAAKIASLVDAAGALRPDWRHFVRDLALGRIEPGHIRTELEAQLDWLEDQVGPLQHLNLHQHLQLWPSLGAMAVELAAERGIGFVRTPSSAARGPKGAGIRLFAGRLRRRCIAAGVATTDAFSGLDEAGAWTLGDLERALAGPGRTLEINVHPGAEHDADRARYTWGYTWSSELRALCSDEARAALDRSGRVLVGASNG